MKKYLKLPKFISEVNTLDTIVVELSVDVSHYIESAQLIGEGILDDTQILAEWQTFQEYVRKAIIKNPSLVLLLEREGSKSPLDHITPESIYYYIGVKNGYGELGGKVVVDFRVSMHQSTKSSKAARYKHEQEPLEDIQKRYSQYNDIEYYGELIVNKKSFKNYDQAKNAVLGKLQKIAETYGESYFPDDSEDD